MSAIKSVLQDDGITINENKYLLSSLTQDCKLVNDRVSTQLPIRKPMLMVLLKFVPEIFPQQPYLILLYQTLFSTAYFGLFWIGELTSGTHPVMAKDVHISENKDKLLFILHTSKTHGQDSKPQMVKITSKKINTPHLALQKLQYSQSNWCPFSLLQRYLDVRKRGFITINEPFFIFRDRTPVSPDNMRTALKRTLTAAGFVPTLYNVRSFRSERAGDLLDLGLSLESVKEIRRWKSNSVYTYLRN